MHSLLLTRQISHDLQVKDVQLLTLQLDVLALVAGDVTVEDVVEVEVGVGALLEVGQVVGPPQRGHQLVVVLPIVLKGL